MLFLKSTLLLSTMVILCFIFSPVILYHFYCHFFNVTIFTLFRRVTERSVFFCYNKLCYTSDEVQGKIARRWDSNTAKSTSHEEYIVLLSSQAWKLGMHGGDYAWILPSDTIDLSEMTGDWWHTGVGECSPSQLSQTLDGLIIVKSHATIVGDEISASGLVRCFSFLARFIALSAQTSDRRAISSSHVDKRPRWTNTSCLIN